MLFECSLICVAKPFKNDVFASTEHNFILYAVYMSNTEKKSMLLHDTIANHVLKTIWFLQHQQKSPLPQRRIWEIYFSPVRVEGEIHTQYICANAVNHVSDRNATFYFFECENNRPPDIRIAMTVCAASIDWYQLCVLNTLILYRTYTSFMNTDRIERWMVVWLSTHTHHEFGIRFADGQEIQGN